MNDDRTGIRWAFQRVGMSIVGRTYLERGSPVIVVCAWGPGGGPRNVWIRRADGTQVIRPFRGLRKPKAAAR